MCSLSRLKSSLWVAGDWVMGSKCVSGPVVCGFHCSGALTGDSYVPEIIVLPFAPALRPSHL
jgi:hypothetical protein